MLMDDRLEFCDAVGVANAAGSSIVLGDVVDLGVPGIGGTANTSNYPGGDEPIYLVIQVTTQIITGGTAGLVRFVLASDGVNPIVPATCTDHLATPYVITDDATAINAGIAAGTDFKYFANKVGGLVGVFQLPHGHRYERYLGIYVDTVVEATIAGAINAFLTHTPAKYVAFADGLPSTA